MGHTALPLLYCTYPVPPLLRPWVSALWTLDSSGAGWVEYIWPTLEPDLVFPGSPYRRDGERISAPCLDGVGLRPRTYQHDGADRLTGVKLMPGALQTLLRPGAPRAAQELGGEALSGVWGDPDPALRLQHVIGWLHRHIDPSQPPLEEAIRVLCGCSRVVEAAERLGVSVRTLRRHTVAAVGMTPKEIQRLARFRRSAARLDQEHHRHGFGLVVGAAGYADQAHFSRECRRLTGQPPSHWWGVADSFKRG